MNSGPVSISTFTAMLNIPHAAKQPAAVRQRRPDLSIALAAACGPHLSGVVRSVEARTDRRQCVSAELCTESPTSATARY